MGEIVKLQLIFNKLNTSKNTCNDSVLGICLAVACSTEKHSQ